MTADTPDAAWFQARLERHVDSLGISLVPNTLAPDTLRLVAEHLALMHAWNRRINLTAIRDPNTSVRRHALESLEALSLMAADLEGVLLDLGSGNGFPALPLLCARPAMQGVLCEMRAGKAAFLRATARQLGVLDRVRVHDARVDPAAPLPAHAVLVTLRAFPDPAGTLAALFAQPSAPRFGAIAWMSDEDAAPAALRLDQRGLATVVTASQVTPGTSLLQVRGSSASD